MTVGNKNNQFVDADFHARRQSGLGGSEAAVVCGLNRYRSIIDLYMTKTGMNTGEPDEMTGPQEWGHRLEDVVIDKFQEESGLEIVDRQRFFRNPMYPFVICHVDGIVYQTNGVSPDEKAELDVAYVFEAKTANAYMAKDWGESGTDNVPQEYLIQCQHNILAAEELGIPVAGAYLAVLIGGNDYRQYFIPRNERLMKDLLSVEADFWRRVEEKDPPELDGSAATAKYLAATYPANVSELMVEATPGLDVEVRTLQNLTNQAKELDEQIEGIRNRVKDAIGDNAGMDGTDWRITWKKNKDSKKIDYKAALGSLIEGAVDILGLNPEQIEQLKNLNQAVIDENTTSRPGARVFRVKYANEG